MNNLVQGFLDNDSFFGRFMTKLGIIIAANIMFVLLSIPFFTIGTLWPSGRQIPASSIPREYAHLRHML